MLGDSFGKKIRSFKNNHETLNKNSVNKLDLLTLQDL
jgi:hypothetical protein